MQTVMRCMLAIGTLVLTGCLSTAVRPGYKAGRLTAAVYLDTKEYQSDDMQVAAKVAYRVLTLVAEDGMTDQLQSWTEQELMQLVNPYSVTLKELCWTFVLDAKARIESEIGRLDQAQDAAEYLSNFKAGVDDVLRTVQ